MALTTVSELRLALLIGGLAFLTGLAWWEIRRSLRASSPGRGETRHMAREPVIPDELPLVTTLDWDPPGPAAGAGPAAGTGPAAALALPEGAEAPPAPLAPQAAYVASPQAPPTVTAPLSEDPIVEWPPEGERQILALRLVAVLPDRFAGHNLRQALLSEGFVLGKYSIFHKPDESGRALLSAANLVQPGTFDAEAMDSQRFAGLSLFAILPGPKPPQDTLDDLVNAARGLNDRLEGALQDELGRPLTPVRIASLRQGLSAQAPVSSPQAPAAGPSQGAHPSQGAQPS